MLNRKQYFVREHAGLLKLSDVYDILDPDTRAKIGEAREEISGLVKFLHMRSVKIYTHTTAHYSQAPSLHM